MFLCPWAKKIKSYYQHLKSIVPSKNCEICSSDNNFFPSIIYLVLYNYYNLKYVADESNTMIFAFSFAYLFIQYVPSFCFFFLPSYNFNPMCMDFKSWNAHTYMFDLGIFVNHLNKDKVFYQQM